jgi:hypothetical protein
MTFEEAAETEVLEDSVCTCGHSLRSHRFAHASFKLSGHCCTCGGFMSPLGCKEFRPQPQDLPLWGPPDSSGRVTIKFTAGSATFGYDATGNFTKEEEPCKK